MSISGKILADIVSVLATLLYSPGGSPSIQHNFTRHTLAVFLGLLAGWLLRADHRAVPVSCVGAIAVGPGMEPSLSGNGICCLGGQQV